jgi:FKBP-type peptidyl-prolyl cis-trans isomerase FklB
MRILTPAVTLLAAATVFAVRAQDKPAAKTQTPAPAKAATATKTSATKPAAKAGATTAAKGVPGAVLKTQKEKFSYALGMNIGASVGANLKRQSVDVDANFLAQGLKDAMSGGKTRLTQEEAQAVLIEMQKQKMAEAAAKNKAEGAAYLTANKAKEGVVTLPSGLEYKILKEGTGPKPAATDSVVCNYRGTLINGTEFDSSYKRGQPATFPVNRVIKGWTEALQLMPVGSKWELFVPSSLAYGDEGAPGGAIAPGSTLIFEVELLSIAEKPKEEQPKPEAKPQTEEKKDNKM